MGEPYKQIRVMKMSPNKGGTPDAYGLGPTDYARQLRREKKMFDNITADRNRDTFHHRPSTTIQLPPILRIFLPDDYENQVDQQQPSETELWELTRDHTKAKHEAIIAQQKLEKIYKALDNYYERVKEEEREEREERERKKKIVEEAKEKLEEAEKNLEKEDNESTVSYTGSKRSFFGDGGIIKRKTKRKSKKKRKSNKKKRKSNKKKRKSNKNRKSRKKRRSRTARGKNSKIYTDRSIRGPKKRNKTTWKKVKNFFTNRDVTINPSETGEAIGNVEPSEQVDPEAIHIDMIDNPMDN